MELITKEKRDEIMAREEILHAWMKEKKTNCYREEELTAAGISSPTNEERSAVEIYDFMNDPPKKYFLYVNLEKKVVTTWMGDVLGKIWYAGKEWHSCFGDKRQSIWIEAINGKLYQGTFYKSTGNYARIQEIKRKGEKS